ncbi:MAG TPA: IS982 family transposase [Longimicrobiaceae bacterium]|nr:IS982 family transposase [Longimicrobiaceae bacterium]
MDDTILAIYCLCDDLLQALGHREDPQCEMSDAEVMTTALVAALFFGGNHERARQLLASPRYVPHMLSRSRLSRRMHRLVPLFERLFAHLAEIWKQLNAASTYIIDTFPVPALDNIRIPRARLYRHEAFRGYIPSKRRYFFGLRLCLLPTARGEPIKVFLLPGSLGDATAVGRFTYDLPPGSVVYADRGCTDYTTEDLLQEAQGIELSAMRKKNSERPVPPWTAYVQFHGRKMIETAGSLISQLLPKSIHAVTPQGFELKVFLFVLAYSIQCAL